MPNTTFSMKDANDSPRTFKAYEIGGVHTFDVAAEQIAADQKTIGTSATLIAATREGRKSIMITNHGTVDVFLGGPAVSTTTGVLLAGVKGSQVTIRTSAAIYGIVSSGTQVISAVEAY